MHPRHPRVLPRRWLMTDERLGDALWQALARLPRGAGIVFRHHRTAAGERRRLLRQVERVARARRLTLVVAGRGPGGRFATHNPRGRGDGGGRLVTRSAHDAGDVRRGEGAGAALLFVSPVFATRSHPHARALGPVRLGLAISGARVPVVALGGMDEARFRRLRGLGLYGWAAIDAWTDQKRKAVPR